ncbi:unnamed protein product [Sphagnum jensenii]|uniref:Uncharacterized protein n=2 Tax=Sphagnum jensenii TaxID=128206 RepID=A0ABP0ZZ36_9BRYO
MLVELNQKTALGVPGTAIRLSRANITSSILLKVNICKGTREHAKLQTIPHSILSKLPDKSLVNAAGWNID